MKRKIFVDTSFFKSIIDPDDDFHQKADEISQKLGKEVLVVSNFILDESYTLLRVRCGLDMVKKLREYLFSGNQEIKIVRVQVQDEAKAWEWFLNPWKGLSYTDCTSFAVMKRLNLESVATFDKHFSQAGFKIIN